MQAIEIKNIATHTEAKRQLEICNACRYCESYCSVFSVLHGENNLSEARLEHLANLCHNCRGCYYACQYTAPHEFNLNVPQALAKLRQHTWHHYVYPSKVAQLFHRNGMALSALLVLVLVFLSWFVRQPVGGTALNFYDYMPHNTMVLIFGVAFILPLLSLAIGLKRYWTGIGGEPLKANHWLGAARSVFFMKNLSGGHGDGCNFEDEDRFSNARRYAHQATAFGFLLCFAATSVATVMHYAMNLPAPYSLLSAPKLLGVTGGVLLSGGSLALAYLKLKADKQLSDASVWGGEMAFVVLLFWVSTSGLLLYGLGHTQWLGTLLSFHLATVFTLFVLLPYSKMSHGFFRMAALLREQQLLSAKP